MVLDFTNRELELLTKGLTTYSKGLKTHINDLPLYGVPNDESLKYYSNIIGEIEMLRKKLISAINNELLDVLNNGVENKETE